MRSKRNLCHSLLVAWLTVPALYGATAIFTIHLVAWLTVPALYGATIIFAIHYLWHG